MPETGARPRTAVVTVGDELLSGHTVDTNAAWIGQRLGEVGLPVTRRATVGDDEAEIRRAIDEAAAAHEVVLVTGGLGPTPDDLTREAVAGLLGVRLVEDPEVLRDVQERFRAHGIEELPGPNRRVARVPEGATKLENPVGTAPGLALQGGGALIVLLPGVPRELYGIWPAVRRLLRDRFGKALPPVHVRHVHTSGIPESLLAERVESLVQGGIGPVQIAFLPDPLGVDLRLKVVGAPEAEARRLLDHVEAMITPAVRPWRYDAEDGDLAAALLERLRLDEATVAVAESCTGGLVAKRLTDVAGASTVFVGGVVAYSNAVKIERLGVDPAELEREGAVSEPVAIQMARGVASAFGAKVGMGITGVAGPGGGTEAKPVGTVWYAAAVGERVAARVQRFPGDRRAVRERSAQAALFLALRLLEGREVGS